MPHKVITMELVDEFSPTAEIAGATNAVLLREDGSLYADQVDGAGFVRGLQRKGFDPTGKRALIVGNGGVGSPIAASLAGIGLAGIGLYDPNSAASEKLAARIEEHYQAVEVAIGPKDPEGYDLIVNATPIGMKDGDPLPVDIDRIARGSYVGDVVLKAEVTPFLQAAKDKGCKIQVGSDMLFEMIPACLEFFGFGSATPDDKREQPRTGALHFCRPHSRFLGSVRPGSVRRRGMCSGGLRDVVVHRSPMPRILSALAATFEAAILGAAAPVKAGGCRGCVWRSGRRSGGPASAP
jgi:shikimate dehydrogenase